MIENHLKLKEKQECSVKTGDIVILPLSDVVPDEWNNDAFRMGDLSDLESSIEKNGFFGEMHAYPINGGKFRLEDGHRRYTALLASGAENGPFRITNPPADDAERRRRLVSWNLGHRKLGPADMAKLVSFTYRTFEMMKEKGVDVGPLLEATASELGIGKSTVIKYKTLDSLCPELKSLLDEGHYDWAVLSRASQLTETTQVAFAAHIRLESKVTDITGRWLAAEIEKFKHVKLSEPFGASARLREKLIRTSSFGDKELSHVSSRDTKDPYTAHEQIVQDKDENYSRHRRKDAAKGVRNALSILERSFDGDSFVKEKEAGNTYSYLARIARIARNAMTEYDAYGTFDGFNI